AAAHVRFRSRSFVERLLATAQELLREDPREASQLAGLVPVTLIAAGTVHTPWGQELRVRALACRGNALRLLGDLAAADACFAELRRRLATAKLDDVALHAEVCSLEASLRLAQRRFSEAEDLLDRMVLLTRLAGDDVGLAKAQIQRGILLRQRDQLDAAAAGLREALGLLADADEPKLMAAAAGNLAVLECERERFDAAAEIVETHRELLSSGGSPSATVLLLGLEGRIAQGLGRPEEAAEKFLAAHRLALARGFEYDAALVALDLALLYAEQGRFAEVREIAATIQPLFASREVHREATAAVLLFQQAVAAERITVEAVRSLRDALQRSGRLPAAAQRERPS
ncbi:MAG TPA: hypothetical protein VHM02_14470, partial [Thermoanaerobaculia bacterium]|nr:hypothetical protein [Thermoanaerobaculia bacterium]